MTQSHVRSVVRSVALACLAGAALPSGLQAQSPDWMGSLVISPSPSPYLSDWERVPSTALLTLTYSGTAAVDFVVRVTLSSAERGTVGVTESPVVTVPGGPVSFLYNVRDAAFEWRTVSRNPTVTDAALRNGQLPEGNYRACARVLVGTPATQVNESCAEFSILQPDPPQLLYPQDGADVISTQPIFQWTPVQAPPSIGLRYEVTVVELLSEKQLPRAAIEANIPVLRSVTSTPFLLYPIDALPLERSKRYAWRVRAVDDAGNVLFRDGAQSEIWSFAMADELLRPIGKIADLPDEVELIPGVARLVGLRNAEIERSETDVTIDGSVQLEFLGAGAGDRQDVRAEGLRLGFRGGELAPLGGRLEAEVPKHVLSGALEPYLRFGRLVYTPESGFITTVELTLPGQRPVPLQGPVQLTAAGLFGRLESQGAAGTALARIGRAPVQFAVTSARLSLPEGRLDVGGAVHLFEQDVGCPASGQLVDGVVQLPVYCDPTSGFRPDTGAAKSLLTFGTLSGSLAADFGTDTLGTDLRAPASFSVFGESDTPCAIEFTIAFLRDSIAREDERPNCATDRSQADFGWVRLLMANLRLEQLAYVPGATLRWRALVDLQPQVRGLPNLNLPPIRDVVLDPLGVSLPSLGSEQPGASANGLQTVDGLDFVIRTIGFKGGLVPYRQWLSGRDPGFEWGSGTIWVRYQQVDLAQSPCLNAMPLEVDTLVIRAGRMEASIRQKDFEGGCRVAAAPNLHLRVTSVYGTAAVAADSVARLVTLPTIATGVMDHRLDCGLGFIGCLMGPSHEDLAGELRLNPYGRAIGQATRFAASFRTFDLRFAKLTLAGGTFALGVDTTGAQTAIYDGSVTVKFDKVEEKKADDTKKDDEKKDDAAASSTASTAGSAVAGAAAGLASGDKDEVRADARLDWIADRFLGGDIRLPGPFKLKVGFIEFIVGEGHLDSLGLRVDGRQRVLIEHTMATAVENSTRNDSTYSTRTDTVGVTFANVRLDPVGGDVSAGRISFDGRIALQSDPLSVAINLVGTTIGGLTGGGDAAGDSTLAALGRTATSTNLYGFKLADGAGSFDPTSSTGNVRLVLPGTPTLDAEGLRVSGDAAADAAFAKSRFDNASVSFENGFAMRPSEGRVTTGRALLKVRQYPIAYLEAAGWRVALAELAQTVIPDTLFLRDAATAFVVLKDSAHNLLVEITETADGPRIRTRPETAVRLVVPALKGTRPTAPWAAVSFDLTLERGTWRPIAGELRASGANVADDFAVDGFPLRIDSLYLRAFPDRDPSFGAFGRMAVWPGATEPMKVGLELRSGGELRANVEQAFTDMVPLVGASSMLRMHVDTLRFNAEGRLESGFLWRLELPSRLAYVEPGGDQEQSLARATFRLTGTEASLQDFRAADSLTVVRLPGVDLRLGRMRAPLFQWDFAQNRFDFELLFDVGLQIPAIDSLMLPEIRDIRITPQGITIPAFELPAMPTSADADDPFASQRQQLHLGGFGVTALAYRVSEFRWGWFDGAPPPQFNFGVDLEFSIEDLPSTLEGQAARIAIRALNVGITNGQFTGQFEPVQIPQPIRTPVADISGLFGGFSIADGQVPDIRIGVIGDLRLPDVLACPDEAARRVPLQPGADTLYLASNGTLRGSIGNLIPQCAMDLGPFDIAFGESRVTFAFDAERSRPDVTLDLAATLTVPGETEGQTVSATGRLVLDVDEARVLDASLAIDQPFYWAPDPENPFLRLVVHAASLSRDELRFAATGELRTEDGAGVDVSFDSVAFDLNTLALKSGRIRLVADAAIGVEIPDDGSLLFGIYPPETPRGTTASARLVLPPGAVIDREGVHIMGTATASLGFGGQDYVALSGNFANDFTIGIGSRVGILRGRLDLRDPGGNLIAHVDSVGFWPGNVFAVLPIPAQLGVPSRDVAYLQLRNPADTTQLLVETEFTSETVRLRTAPNASVSLVMPAMAEGGQVPSVAVSFDLVLNSRTMRPISGGFLAEAAPGQSLIPVADLPVQLTRLGFAADTGGFALKAGARARLPGPLANVNLSFNNIEISSQGLTGTIELGQYSEVYNPLAPAIATLPIVGDTLSLTLSGARLTLQPNANVLAVSGGITSSVLRGAGNAPRVITLTATVDTGGFRGTAAVSDPETPFAIGVAELRLENGNSPALTVRATAQEFAVVIGGSVRLPTLAPGFSLGVEDLSIGTAGIQVPNISVTAPSNTREFELFGARFALRDSTVGTQQVAPAVGVAFDRGAFRFTLSGYVTLLQNTTRFIGLQFGTDGSFALQGAEFISRPITIIDSVARITRVALVQNELELRGDVKLPAPFAQGAAQELMLRIRPDGSVTGGGRVVMLNEPAGLATAQTKLSVGLAAFHLRYLSLELDFASQANTAVSLVADVYLQENPNSLLRFGSVNGGTVNPGLRIAMNGNVTWGGLTMPNPITIDLDPLTLNFRNVTSTTTASGFSVDISGGVGLALAGVQSNVQFSHVVFSSSGGLNLGSASIDGGQLVIQDVLKVSVGRFAFSDSDTTVWVPIKRPPGSNGEIQQDSALVGVSTFLTFGASVDIAGAFVGSLDRFLVYVRTDDQTTHLLLENLAVNIPGVLEFTANFSYDQLVNGFDMALATEGLLLGSTRIGLVGVLGREAEVFRAGIFLRVGLPTPITIIPGIISLTEVGGGLFINPRPTDLALVKQVAALNGPAANMIGMPPATSFAVMLYAGIQVAGSGGVAVAAGRALVTVTDMAFQINAEAIFFDKRGELYGDLALQIGWSPQVYARGAVSLNVRMDSVVTGTALVQFYAGGGVFAVKGNVDLVLLTVINSYAEVIIVPSGFTANLGFSVQKATSVVSVSVGANLRIWYRPSTNDLGAYMKLEGQVTAFGVTGAIGLIGALVIQPEFALYAQGYARIVGIDALNFGVWVQYTTAGLTAGLGQNEELAAVLARAEQIAADLEAEANRILAGIDANAMERARTPIPVSDASLAAAFDNFQRWNWYQLLGAWGLFRLAESGYRGGLVPMQTTDPYVAFYERTLTSTDAAADTAIVRQRREEAQQKLQVINDRRAAVEQRIRELRLELQVAEAAAQFVPPADPVLQWSSGSPSFVEGPTLPDGRVSMVLINAPSFDLDDQAAGAARSAMSAAQADNAARAPRLRAQIEAVEAGLSTVFAATRASDANSFASYARVHSDLVEAVEHLHAANVDFRMRRRRWAQGKIDSLASFRPSLVQRINDRLLTIPTYWQQQSALNDRTRRVNTARDLDSLAHYRATFLSAWAKDPSIINTYKTERVAQWQAVEDANRALFNNPNDGAASGRLDVATTWFTTQAANYGLQDWWGVANAGLTVARDGAQAVVDSADAQARPVIRAMRDMHARITRDLDELNTRQAELIGTLFDLYDGYLRTYGSADSVGQRYVARRAELGQLLTAPVLSTSRVVVTDFGYLSSVHSTWSGAHPAGVYEYLMREGSDSLLTVGAQGTAKRWQYTTDQGGASIAQNEELIVRGGAGYTGRVLTPYTVTFARGTASNPASTVATPPVDLSPPTEPLVEITELASIAGITGEPVFWTGDSTRLVARWSASDQQSGISQYEYRVVSWAVPTSSVSTLYPPGAVYTATMAAAIAPVELRGWTAVGGRTNVAIQGLSLPANRWIRVEVRATNGTGLLSGAGISSPVQFDPTRPVFAAGATTAPALASFGRTLPAMGFTISGFAAALQPTCGMVQTLAKGPSRKVWDGRLVTVTPTNGVVGGGASYSIAMTRPDASDPETGIGAYLYRVDTVAPSGAVPADGWSDIIEPGGTFTARGPLLVYGKPRWISLVAVNQAGRMSVPLTHGPFQINDATGPTAPSFCGDFASGFIAYLTTASTDNESGVRGYQLRVRGPSGAVLRDFPSGGAVDWPASQAAAGSGIRLAITPSMGGNHIVDLRPVNGAGTVGDIASSGQVMVDVTPPPPAGVIASVASKGTTLTLTIAPDLESGIAGVDVAFGTGPSDLQTRTGTMLMPYTTYPATAGTSTVLIPAASSAAFAEQSPVYVWVRVRNGAGLVSTLTSVQVR